jgi:hypothetical protein
MELKPQPASIVVHSLEPRLWTTYNWAREWFADAVVEAKVTGNEAAARSARRREIISAVCFAESYLFEWVRDEVLKRDFDRLLTYFPSGVRRGADEKWREIPKRLHADRLIPHTPDFGGPHGEEWGTLLEYRDGLIHAAASRPAQHPPANEPRTVPSAAHLNHLAPGWAALVVKERVERLHHAAGTPPPAWLVLAP